MEVFDLTRDDLAAVLDLAVDAREAPHGRGDLMKGEIVFCLFAKPSTRTRVSFAAAAARLGGEAVFAGADELQLGRGETIEDTAMAISGYARAAVIRTSSHDDAARFAAAAPIPVVNALTGAHHPCQALADLMTIKDRFGSLEGLRVAYVGVGNNVAHSLTQACALTGADVAVAVPGRLSVDAAIVEGARVAAAAVGASVEVTDDPTRAVRGADVVYTDAWMSMGDPEDEREARRLLLRPYRVTADLMALASGRAVFMHCLPAHRGDEVTGEVIDGDRSVIAAQAENRLHTAQAMLAALLEGRLAGRA